MKIIGIYIYGYGKLENIKIENIRDLNVFYGVNEAGKSTIMSFIHSMLFGFPTKQQSDLRYEPKKGAKYGGQLVVYFEMRGRVVIERVKGKATGDVSVQLEDGTVGGEELLKELIFSIDKALYQAIFSFNIHGLQNVHQLKGEDLGKFLFSTGTIGTDKLLTVENHLQKQLDARFKPNGKKPLLNERLTEAKEAYGQLKRAEQKNEQYNSLIAQRDELQEAIFEGREKISLLQQQSQLLEEWKKLSPFVKEKKLCENELANLQTKEFPVDGILRLDQLKGMMQPLEGQLAGLNDQIRRVNEELEGLKPNKEFLELEPQIHHAIEKIPLYEALKEEEQEWQARADKVRAEIADIQASLHTPLNADSLQLCNTSMLMKEATLEAERKQRRLAEQKIELDSKFHNEKDNLVSLEEKLHKLEEEMLSEEESKEIENRLSQVHNQADISKELAATQSKLSFLQTVLEKERGQEKKAQLQTLILCIVFLVITAWSLWQVQWMITAIAGVGMLFLVFLYLQRRNKQSPFKQEHVTLTEIEKKLRAQLRSFSPEEIRHLEEKLKEDKELREKLNIVQIRWSQQNEQFEKIIHTFEMWENESREHRKQLLALGEQLLLPEEVALHHLHDAFLLIEKLKECIREQDYTELQLSIKKDKCKQIRENLCFFGERFLTDHDVPIQQLGFLLKKQIKAETEKYLKYHEKIERMNDLAEQAQKENSKYSLLLKEREDLFQRANVKSEDDYRTAGLENEKRLGITKRVEELSRQIQLSSFNEEKIQRFLSIKDIQYEIECTLSEIQSYERKLEEVQQRLAAILHEIRLLEDGGVYGDLYHQYSQLQSQLHFEAKEWVKLSLAKEMLRKTVARFKEERLPEMLKKAEDYLFFLTEGQYARIIPKQDSNGFIIERTDHILFEANELSQATMEQVYVSLRLALATTIYKKHPLPIIIDDSFVNFDHFRTDRVLELLKGMKENQILFFTCHKHLLEGFAPNERIMLEEQTSPAM